MIAHAEFPKARKKNQIRKGKETQPSGNMRNQ